MSAPLYLANATHIDARTHAIVRGHLRVDAGPGGTVSFVDVVPPGANVIDVSGRIVTRAFAVGHHHVYSALARGMPAPPRSPRSFVEVLELIWWRLDRCLDHDMIVASALVTAIDAARCGSTFVIDHHSSPHAIPGSLEAIAAAFDQVGVGHLLCIELSDRDGPAAAEAGLAETDAYLARRPGLVGLHASFTVGDELLAKAVALAQRHDTGLHVHVAEATSDEDHAVATYGRRVIRRFADAGVLASPRTLLAHCLHLDATERALVVESPAWVVQNTESNTNNAVGQFDPRGLGSRVLLGTDGMHSDMLGSLRAAFLAGQTTGGLSPAAAVSRLYRVRDYLAESGVVTGDNDLVVLDYDPPTPVTSENWAGHVAYGLSRAHVQTVIAAGRPIVRDRAITTVNESEILAEARVQAARLWSALGEV